MLKNSNHQTTGMGAEVNLVKCQRKNILVFVSLTPNDNEMRREFEQ